MTPAESRAFVEQALVKAGLRVLPQGSASPPSVFVAPGNDWISAGQLAFGRAGINWVVVCVVSAANEVAARDIDDLAYAVMSACKNLPPEWGLPEIGAPGVLTLAGLPYLAFRAEIQGVL